MPTSIWTKEESQAYFHPTPVPSPRVAQADAAPRPPKAGRIVKGSSAGIHWSQSTEPAGAASEDYATIDQYCEEHGIASRESLINVATEHGNYPPLKDDKAREDYSSQLLDQWLHSDTYAATVVLRNALTSEFGTSNKIPSELRIRKTFAKSTT
jgi:hypothetical protein